MNSPRTPLKPPVASALWLTWPVALCLAGCAPRLEAPGVALATAAPPSAGPAVAAHAPQVEGPEEAPPIRFRDASEGSGITFVHRSGNSPEKLFPTCLGSGVAMLDYDGDGRLDLYFATTGHLPPDPADPPPGNRLYRNRGDGTFEDVTEAAGVGFHGFNHGVTVADVDNNCWPDLYLTNLGRNVLYLNNGDGTFRDASAGSGLECGLWSCGAAFLDYDNDGRLDLYVSNYGRWAPGEPHPFCGDKARKIATICSPTVIKPQRHVLFHNRGGWFEDVTESAGVLRLDGRGMGVLAADLNRDGKIDLYVANDKCPCFLFLNRGDGTFIDAGESSGAAFTAAGAVQGSMGLDAEDVDGDGLPDLIVTNFIGDGSVLRRNIGGGDFQDVTASSGILKESKPYVGWGTALADFDNDRRPDLLIVNGHVDDNLAAFDKDEPQAEPARVWRNEGGGRFRVIRDPGPWFRVPHVARGAAFGDLDNDGDLDVVVSLLDARPAILLNESPPRHWLRLELVGRRSNRSAIGASIEVHCGDGVVHYRQVKGGGSYLSANDPRLLVGLGDLERVNRVEVSWPSGARLTLAAPALNHTYRLVEPAGGPTGPHALPPEGRR
jgi:hypothetical protein